MRSEAARPKGLDRGDEPTTQPMRATRVGEIRRNPSTDQKRQRRLLTKQADVEPGQKSATILGDTEAWKLNPGDSVRTPDGRTVKVKRVRPHESGPEHYYVDTDSGTALVKRNDTFQVVPHNSQQRGPGYGVPGGNSNSNPFDPQGSPGGVNSLNGTQCPNCGRHGTLGRNGDHYSCSHCGYSELFGGPGGHGTSTSPSRTFASLNTFESAITRAANLALAQKEITS